MKTTDRGRNRLPTNPRNDRGEFRSMRGEQSPYFFSISSTLQLKFLVGTDARTKDNVLLLRLPAQSYGSWLFEQSWPARNSLTACCYFMFTAQPTFRILMARFAPILRFAVRFTEATRSHFMLCVAFTVFFNTCTLPATT